MQIIQTDCIWYMDNLTRLGRVNPEGKLSRCTEILGAPKTSNAENVISLKRKPWKPADCVLSYQEGVGA